MERGDRFLEQRSPPSSFSGGGEALWLKSSELRLWQEITLPDTPGGFSSFFLFFFPAGVGKGKKSLVN